MTSWGLILLGSGVALGLSRPRTGVSRYAIGFAIVFAMIVYAGVRQHTL